MLLYTSLDPISFQLLDELPMIYGTCVFIYALHHHNKPAKTRSMVLVSSLVLCSAFVTAVYLRWKNPIFHQVCYAFLVFFLLGEAIVAMRNYPKIKPVALTSLACYVTGFILWNIDNIYCSSLRSVRESGGSLEQATTQLHAWWHILTGYATYLHIVFSSYARLLHLRRSCSIMLLDEFPMIYASCIFIYGMRTLNLAPCQHDFRWFAVAVLYSAFSTFVYLVQNMPLLFQFLYGVVSSIMVYEVVRLGLSIGKVDNSFRILAAGAIFTYAVGFCLWNIDNNFCPTIRSARASTTNLGNAVTQLHAWWHLLAAYASHLQMQLTILARRLLLKKRYTIAMFIVWPYVDWNDNQEKIE